jgi:hypothetical protein
MIASFIRVAMAGSFSISRAQLLQHQAALAVADEDERPSLVPCREIISPSGRDISVGEIPRGPDVGAGGVSGHGTQGHLAVYRREGPARSGEAGKLDFGHGLFFGDIEIAVQPLVSRDRRIHVETVERRVACHGAQACGAIAVGIERRRRQRGAAGISPARQAQPARLLRIIWSYRRRGRLSRNRRRDRQRGGGDH